ncbi:MAG: cytochrome-c oxidase, cbb3-type subunit III [bacterium]
MTTFWSWYIILITAGVLLACLWLITYTMKTKPGEKLGENEMKHKWDGDLVEYNNPLPKWWLNLFYITIIFAFSYLVLYPGAGNFKGYLGWTSIGQWQQQMDEAEAKYGPLFAKYSETPIAELAKNDDALKLGRSQFANNCAVCHGSDARGAKGFPNLTDNDWLWGGDADKIEQTITSGRKGGMPAWGPSLGEQGVTEVVEYVKSISGKEADSALAEAGKTRFQTFCVACHGADGKGNQMLGAPNLTDDIWLFGGNTEDLVATVTNGRSGEMPAHGERLGKDRVHLVAAYVYSLSH